MGKWDYVDRMVGPKNREPVGETGKEMGEKAIERIKKIGEARERLFDLKIRKMKGEDVREEEIERASQALQEMLRELEEIGK